jgi:hypothetical protein
MIGAGLPFRRTILPIAPVVTRYLMETKEAEIPLDSDAYEAILLLCRAFVGRNIMDLLKRGSCNKGALNP